MFAELKSLPIAHVLTITKMFESDRKIYVSQTDALVDCVVGPIIL